MMDGSVTVRDAGSLIASAPEIENDFFNLSRSDASVVGRSRSPPINDLSPRGFVYRSGYLSKHCKRITCWHAGGKEVPTTAL